MPNRRPIVTFDLDGVLCRPLLGINPGTGKGKRREAQGKRSLLWMTERWRYAFRRPMPGAIDGFRAVAAIADVCIVSARSEQARGLTEAWFRRHFGELPEIHLRPSWHETSAQFKARRVLELGASAHFEDDPFTAAWLSELGPCVFLVDWPRNRDLAGGTQLVRVSAVADALPLILAGDNASVAGLGQLPDQGTPQGL